MISFNKNILSGIAAILLIAFVGPGCDDIVEKDISDKQVFLVAPSNDVELDSGRVTFLWDFVEGATDYELLVLAPNFDTPATVHADTITDANSFETTLGIGEYAWGVRAFNSAHSTVFFVNHFVVVEGDLDPDISEGTVTYFSPRDSVEIEEGSIIFLWDRLNDARRYRFQLVTPGFDAISAIVLDTVTVADQLSVDVDSGNYQWRVFGVNDFSRTLDAEIRTLLVD